MNATGPVERAVAVLEEAGYETVEKPRRIGGISFDFAAMLAGRASLDLIALVDLAVDADDEPVRRRVAALARALDLVRSRRSLTIVLVGPRRPELIQALTGVARVLNVGSAGEGNEVQLRDGLAVLLPFQIATEDVEASNPWTEARDRVSAEHPAETQPILAAAQTDVSAVEVALREMLGEPILAFYAAADEGEPEE